jgi:hypothetical protein
MSPICRGEVQNRIKFQIPGSLLQIGAAPQLALFSANLTPKQEFAKTCALAMGYILPRQNITVPITK